MMVAYRVNVNFNRKDGERIMTHSAKLKGKIVESGLNQTWIAEQLGMTLATFNYFFRSQ